jgi:hypothetical protein
MSRDPKRQARLLEMSKELVRSYAYKLEPKRLTRHETKNMNVRIDDEETTGALSGKDAFLSVEGPDVCGVVIDRWSERGSVQITGKGYDDVVITTGDRTVKEDIVVEWIKPGQTCMLFYRPTVRFLRPAK